MISCRAGVASASLNHVAMQQELRRNFDVADQSIKSSNSNDEESTALKIGTTHQLVDNHVVLLPATPPIVVADRDTIGITTSEVPCSARDALVVVCNCKSA